MEFDSSFQQPLDDPDATAMKGVHYHVDAMSAPLSHLLLPDRSEGRYDSTLAGIEAALPSDIAAPPILQRHYIDGVLHEDIYPDAAVQEAVTAKMEQICAVRGRFYTALDSVSNLNERYEEEVSWMRSQVAADIGPRALELPVTILASEEFMEVRQALGLGEVPVAGMYRHGHAVVHDDPVVREQYGEAPLIKALGHEFIHGMYDKDNNFVLTLPLHGNEQRVSPRDIVAGGRIVRTVNGLGLSTPDSDMPWDPALDGSFFEEGIAESYALKKRDAYLLPVKMDNRYRQNASIDVGPTAHVHYGNAVRQLIDPDTGMLCLPWKYAISVVRRPDDTFAVLRSPVALAAFGIDLLEAYRLPNLSKELLLARNDPERKLLVRDSINRIYDGNDVPLNTRLSHLEYTPRNFLKGVRMIIRALQIADEPLFRVVAKL